MLEQKHKCSKVKLKVNKGCSAMREFGVGFHPLVSTININYVKCISTVPNQTASLQDPREQTKEEKAEESVSLLGLGSGRGGPEERIYK